MKKLSTLIAASTLFIAGTAFAAWGDGGNLHINNTTPYSMIASPTSHNMTWEFPAKIDNGQNPGFYNQFNLNGLCIDGNTWGKAYYKISCPAGTDTIKFDASVSCGGFGNNVRHIMVSQTGSNCVTFKPSNTDPKKSPNDVFYWNQLSQQGALVTVFPITKK